MAKDYTANIAPALRPLLRDGEQLLGASPLVKDPGTTDELAEYAQRQVERIQHMQQDLAEQVGAGRSPRGLVRAAPGRAASSRSCGSIPTRCGCRPTKWPPR